MTYTEVYRTAEKISLRSDVVDGTTFRCTVKVANVKSLASSMVTEDVPYWESETITAQPGINGNEALHTAAVYTDSYVGDVVVQATLDNQVIGGTVWADIATYTMTGSETEPTPINFNGVFSHLRFKATANPAEKITKVFYLS